MATAKELATVIKVVLSVANKIMAGAKEITFGNTGIEELVKEMALGNKQIIATDAQ